MTGATVITPARSSQPAHHLLSLWSTPFHDALGLLRDRISLAGLIELTTIDTTSVLASAGFTIPEVGQVLVFHPRFMRTILETDPAAVVEAPLKLTIIQRPTATELRCVDPAIAFAPYPGLSDLAAALHDLARTLLDAPAD